MREWAVLNFSRNCDQQAPGNAKGLLMPTPKAVFVTRFNIPAEFMLSRGGPVHKVRRHFPRERVRRNAVLSRMNPLPPAANHKLRFLRQRPRLFEEKVSAPFRRVPFEERRNARLKFQTVLDLRNLYRKGRTESRAIACDALGSGRSNFDNCGRLFLAGLRESFLK